MSEKASAVFGSSTRNADLPEAVNSSPEKQQIQELHIQLQSALKEIGTLRQRAVAESHSQASLAGDGAESAVAGSHIALSVAKDCPSFTCLPFTIWRLVLHIFLLVHRAEHLVACLEWLSQRLCAGIQHQSWARYHDSCACACQSRAIQGLARLEVGV